MKSSNKFQIDIFDKLQYCQQLLKFQSKKQIIKHYQLKLTSEEKILFDEEELLSSYQHIIANTCGQHCKQQQMKILLNRSSIKESFLPIHRYCRKGSYPGTSIQRQQINDNQVPWIIDLPNYNPSYYTHSSLLNDTNDVDPEIITTNFMWNTFDTNYNIDRRTANPIGYYPIDKKGYPLNPLGRTGLCGRGKLKYWAVNYQTHLVIMCGTNEIKSGQEIFKYLMVKPKHDHYYRLLSTSTTGTNMNAIKKTLKTFLSNIYQTWNDFDNNNETKIDEIIKHLTFVSTAYIDDPKNTDNAWLETSICCYIQTNINENISSNQHIDLNELFPHESLNEKTSYIWYQVTRTSKVLDSERDVIRLIAKRYNAYW
ncbi:unnamed protein product [Rotaria sordida]|uniref:Uncharacterized protein n=2 Tax=Rotaria sordida TaxID=392033 RepID=A0A818RDT7_9BILA|nr:unnamed protein product [Rotaria sordida]CAF3651396.1 unnamed protein product [Rotaria sordida]CAF4025742.1 unnamed protein product [Rotaria sordida]